MWTAIKRKTLRAFQYIWHGIPEQYINVEVKISEPSGTLLGKNMIITGGARTWLLYS